MTGFMQLVIVGHVGADVKFRFTPSGVPVADFSVAVNLFAGRNSAGERAEKTTWFRVTCWRGLAEIANDYVRKGAQVMVVGTVEASAYLTKAGQAAASLEVTADKLQLLGSRADSQRDSSPASTDPEWSATPWDQIPF